MKNQEKPNTFQELEEQQKTTERPLQQVSPVQAPGEIDLNKFSDVAIGEKVKYNRPDLNNTDDVIDKFQVFPADTTQEPKVSQAGTSRFWLVTMILSYGSKNEDDVQNREYISGARQFMNKDGSPSDIQFWYPGSETQSAYLWELVAKHLGKKPEEISPRQFVAFLNNRPEVRIRGIDYKNYGAKPGDPKFVTKNMPGSFKA